MILLLKYLGDKKYFLLKIFFIIVFLCDDTVFSQEVSPPKGLITFRLGYRSYTEQTYSYDKNGNKVSLGDPFYTRINLSELFSDTISKNDSKSSFLNFLNKIGIIKSLLDQDIGVVTGDVSARISAKYLGLAFGITDNVAIMVAPSLLKADVKVQINYEENSGVKKPFGGLITDMIKNNFDSLVSLYIESLGYESLDDWSYSGWGDTRVALMLSNTYNLRNNFLGISELDLQLMIPTGYMEKPEILQDVTLEIGYYQLLLRYTQKFIYKTFVWVDAVLEGGYSFSMNKEVRVPEVGSNDNLLPKERTTEVSWKPGNDINMNLGINGFYSFIHPRVAIGYKKHFEDEYSGKGLEGNYKALSEESESMQTYMDLSLEIDTSKLYVKKRFLIPFMFNFSYHQPLESENYTDERYFELTLQSFIPTPWFKNPRNSN